QPLILDNDSEVISFKYYVPRFGQMPQDIFAVLSAEPEQMLAVKYQDGKRKDKEARDYREEIFSLPECWLVLCLPSKPPAFYENLFAQKGFCIEDRHHFQRIDVYRFSKATEKANVPIYGSK